MIDGSISVDLNYERLVAWNRHEGRHGKAMQFHKTLANSEAEITWRCCFGTFL